MQPSSGNILDKRLDQVLAEARYKDIAPRKKKLLKFLAKHYLNPNSNIQDVRRVLRTLKTSSSPGHQLGVTEVAVKEKIKKYIKPYIKSTTPTIIDDYYTRFRNQQDRLTAPKPKARTPSSVGTVAGGGGGGGGGDGGAYTQTFHWLSRPNLSHHPLGTSGRGYKQLQQDGSTSSTSSSSFDRRGSRGSREDRQLEQAIKASLQTNAQGSTRRPPPHAATARITLPVGGVGGGVGGTPFRLRRETTGGQKVGIAVHTDDLTRDVQRLFTNPEFSDQKNFNDEILRLVEHYKGKYAGDIMEVINTTMVQKMKKDIEQMLFTDLTNIIRDQKNNYRRYIIELGHLYRKYKGKNRDLLVTLIGKRLAEEKQKVKKQLSKQASRRLDGGGGSSL